MRIIRPRLNNLGQNYPSPVVLPWESSCYCLPNEAKQPAASLALYCRPELRSICSNKCKSSWTKKKQQPGEFITNRDQSEQLWELYIPGHIYDSLIHHLTMDPFMGCSFMGCSKADFSENRLQLPWDDRQKRGPHSLLQCSSSGWIWLYCKPWTPPIENADLS